MSDADELKEALDLEYWFEREGRSFKMTRGVNGVQLNAKDCPACGDNRWRTYFNAETGMGNCFKCSEGFNKLKFVNLALGLSWGETFNHVREVLVEQGWRPKRKHTAAVEIGEVKLPNSFPLPTPMGANLAYLEDRGIGIETAKYFHLRYCTSGWWNFTNEDGTPGGQRFDDRVIIPVFDLDGTLATFQGRDVGGTSDRKYLFPKMLPGTGRYLYNGQNAGRAKRAVMGEGAFDVMAIKLALDEDVNLRDVVPLGSFGKHLSFGAADGNDQLGRFMILKRGGLKEVTIMWDGEPMALIAALDAAKILTRIGLIVKIALLPPDRDPNEVLPEVVRGAFTGATLYTATLDVKWRLRNPYSPRKK